MLTDSESSSDSSTEPGPSKRRKNSKRSGVSQQKLHVSGGNVYNFIGSVKANNAHFDSRNIDQLNQNVTDESFRRDLEQRANEICGEEDRFRGDKIKIAPLQISTKIRDIKSADRSGHFHRRQDVAKFFHENPRGNISYVKLFKIARQLAKKKAFAKCSNKDAQAKYRTSHGNIVFITGQAGIGKTTFTKLLVQKIVNPEKRLFNAEFVFYLRFRDIKYERKIDLLQFLTVGGSPSVFKKYEGRTRTAIINKIDECKNVCIVMDGLDEAKLSKSSFQPIESLDSREKPEVFIKNIICGQILPKSKKIITSRPRQISQLHTFFVPNFVVNILGLDEKGQEQICQDLFSDNVNRQNQILQYLNTRPDLKSYCYVPINCILIMISFNQADFTKLNNVYSLSTILVTALESWFLTKFEDDESFQTREISNLAYKGFIKDKYYFEEWDLQKVGVNFLNISTFLTNNIKFELLNADAVVSYFGHLIWQEFFVATKMRLFMDFEEFKETVSKIDSEKFEVVAKFLFGLCNKSTKRKLLGRIDTRNVNTPSDRKSCKEMLKKFVIEKLKKIRNDLNQEQQDLDELPEFDVGSSLSASAFGSDGAMALSEQHVANLSGGEDVQSTDSVGETDNDSRHDIGSSSDRRMSRDANDEWSSDGDDRVNKTVVDDMDDDSSADDDTSLDCDSDVKEIVDLLFDDSDKGFKDDEEGSIDDEEGYFSLINPVLTWLYEMRDDEFTKEAANCLDDFFSIDLTDQVLPSDISCFIYVLQARTTEMILQIHFPDFAGNCLHYFFQELDETLQQNRNISFQQLYLEKKDLGDDDVKYLCFSLANTLEETDLRDCKLTATGIKVLANSIRKRNTPMEQLTLDGNHVGDDGGAALESCLPLIKNLAVRRCGISPEMQKRLKEQVVALGHAAEF